MQRTEMPGLLGDDPCGYQDVISTEARPFCYLCGERGERLYDGLKDRLFGAPGNWNLKRCPVSGCGLIWLDPMPQERSIGKAYSTYYTHKYPKTSEIDRSGSLTNFIRRVFYKRLLRILLIRKERKRLRCMYLDRMPAGRLVEVGCGDGKRLAGLRALGWVVMGQEIDPIAAENARRIGGLNVHLGPLETLGSGREAFDAVIMNHVIEHVHDPISLLRECRHILKPGGRLVVVTPNATSWGHRRFGEHWRGLEPPRHLHLFSRRTLSEVAHKAGFSKFHAWTTAANAETIARGSLEIRSTGKHAMHGQSTMNIDIASKFFQILASLIHMIDKNSGEECVLMARK